MTIFLDRLWCTQYCIDLEKAGRLVSDTPFAKKVVLGKCPDGEIEIIDGHHRVVAYVIKKREVFRYGEYVLLEIEKPRVRFGQIAIVMKRLSHS